MNKKVEDSWPPPTHSLVQYPEKNTLYAFPYICGKLQILWKTFNKGWIQTFCITFMFILISGRAWWWFELVYFRIESVSQYRHQDQKCILKKERNVFSKKGQENLAAGSQLNAKASNGPALIFTFHLSFWIWKIIPLTIQIWIWRET